MCAYACICLYGLVCANQSWLLYSSRGMTQGVADVIKTLTFGFLISSLQRGREIDLGTQHRINEVNLKYQCFLHQYRDECYWINWVSLFESFWIFSIWWSAALNRKSLLFVYRKCSAYISTNQPKLLILFILLLKVDMKQKRMKHQPYNPHG